MGLGEGVAFPAIHSIIARRCGWSGLMVCRSFLLLLCMSKGGRPPQPLALAGAGTAMPCCFTPCCFV